MKTNKLLLVFIGILASVGLSSGEVSNDFVNISDSGDQTRFRRNADSLSDKLSDQDIQFTSSSTSNQTRFTRNADPLSDYSGKLSTVARISNGISLLAGLINKNIPIDTVIEELLHFGNVELSDVLAIQKDTVEAVINQLNSIKNDLVTSSKLDVLEKNTIGMSRVREAYIEIGDFGNFKYPDDYFKEAQSFKDDQTNYTVFKTAASTAKSAIDALAKLDNVPELSPAASARTAADILDVVTNLNKLEKVNNDLETLSQQIGSLGNLINGAETLKPVQQMLDLLAVHRSLPSIDASDVAEAGKNFDKISPLSLAFAQSNLAVLSDLISSRLKPSSTKRQFTPGFPNGASDLKKLVKDIRDPSFETTIGGGKNFARLSAGLKPLEGFSAKVEASEAQLEPLVTVEILKSIGNAVELQTLMTGLTVSSDEATAVTQMLLDNQFGKIDDIRVTAVVNLMRNAVKVSEELARIKAFPQPPQDVTDVKEILKKLPDVRGQQDVQNVINELKSVPDKVKKVTEYLNKLEGFLKDAPDPTATRQTADLVFQADGELKNLKDLIDKVIPKLTAIRDTTKPIDMVVKALKAIKVIKDFKPEDISKIRSAVDTVSQASNSIKDLQKTPTSRKKRQTDEVKELIGFKDALKTSEALGSAAVGINSMDQLKGLEKTIQALATSTMFNTELGKIQNQQKKDQIQKKWGDHKAFISSLDTTLGQIKDFEKKLSTDKDLRKLGAHLNDAKAVGDVTQNIADKSEAVGLLILETSDAKAKADLEKLKSQLDTLAALDLQFSNHHSAFSGVPAALNSLFDFITGFLTPKKLPPPPPLPPGTPGPPGATGAPGSQKLINGSPSSGSATSSTSNNFDFMILVYVGIGIVVLVALGVCAFFIYRCHKDRKKDWDTVEELWLAPLLGKERCGQKFEDNSWDYIQQVKKGSGSTVEKKMRRTNTFHSSTRVKISNGFINANWIKVIGAPVFIATQGPLDSTEFAYVAAEGPRGKIRAKNDKGEFLGKSQDKADTREDFLQMVCETGAEFIVMLCRVEERDLEFPGDTYMVQKSAKYWPPVDQMVVHGRYQVTNRSEREILNGEGVCRELRIHDNKTGKDHMCKHLHWLEWGDHDIPSDWLMGLELMEKVCESPKPIIVHCSMGLGRTCSFIAIETMACEAERRPHKHPKKMIADMRRMRCGAIQSPQQFHYAFICALARLIKKFGGDLVSRCDEKTAVFEEHLDAFKEARELETVGAGVVPTKNRRGIRRDRMMKKKAEKEAKEEAKAKGTKSKEASKEASKTPESSATGSKSAEPSREPAGQDVVIDMGN